MTPSLLRPQVHLSNAEALKLAQLAPEVLKSNPKVFSTSPLAAMFSASETGDVWTIYENLLLACLRTGDDKSASDCLERIVIRFGPKDERVMALEGLTKEAKATNNNDLDKILKEYDAILKENDANVPIAKRKVALLRSMGKIQESIAALITLLEFNTTDSEAWAELADMYLEEGLYAQAIYALEEVLILQPNSWNTHARLGEVSLMAASALTEGSGQQYAIEALKRFSRSIELCDDYLRGYYGLKLSSDKLLDGFSKGKKQQEDGFPMPDTKTIQKLNQLATTKLAEIVRRHGAQEKLWQGYDAAEVAAARELLSKSSAQVVR
ncbi:TPR repeat protein oca3 [Beauveria bassiana]|uniref:ER membrane protein complex subunit 2 n=1 Tax=Beauveria bassiana TaxID=176275 RepID=A0A2N6NL36_BEABA|nr:TPR repeat protein oca3 [Beauveria bassiana]